MSAKIKICGLFREDDIDYANAATPDYVGFVFAPSRRRVTAETAARLRRRLDGAIIPVGVFVNAEIDDIISLYNDNVISVAQLHGGEDAAYIAALKARNIPVIQAIRAGPGDTASDLTDFLLFDGGAGGTGEAYDRTLIGEVNKPFFIAGGINIDNIGDALARNPYGIDVSSGAETDGFKDFSKIQALVNACK
ncbi:MAG: phosphoribosylanthranilate isomerase [Oscillospiraceae bacterium]|jgi:phosphoribosylanthranilate isomerase|nr:phosphoribosylanthranilate isomerase [Oscillospiraceae bacterium]